jgi:hypothetical protein
MWRPNTLQWLVIGVATVLIALITGEEHPAIAIAVVAGVLIWALGGWKPKQRAATYCGECGMAVGEFKHCPNCGMKSWRR